MGRSGTLTKLPLATFAKIMGINPLHFEGVSLPQDAIDSPICSQPMLQYEWQDHDRVGREQVARAIADSEADLEHALGWRLLPSWETDERVDIPRPYRPELYAFGGDVRWYNPSTTTRWKKLISGGIRGTSLIDDNAAIVYTDEDSDGYAETATVTVTTAVTPCEVRVFYPGKAADPAWEIRPVTARAAGATVVLTFRRELCVFQALLDALDAEAVNGLDNANFLTVVDVYRVFNDPQTQVSFLWEPTGGNCGCAGGSCSACVYATQTGCLLPRDARLGSVAFSPADWDAENAHFDTTGWSVGRRPDIARLYYFAGNRCESQSCPDVTMDPDWQRTVAYFAASRLDRVLCDCSAAFTEKWQEELGFERGATELAVYRLSEADLNNPFGTARGAIYAWRRANRLVDGPILTQAVKVI